MGTVIKDVDRIGTIAQLSRIICPETKVTCNVRGHLDKIMYHSEIHVDSWALGAKVVRKFFWQKVGRLMFERPSLSIF